MKENLPLYNPTRIIKDLQNRPGGDTFATAALPNDAERLTAPHNERNAIDGPHDTVIGEKLRFKIFDFKQ